MILAVVLFVIGLALYIQGNYANIDYGVLDGREIVWGEYLVYAILDSAGWLVLLAGGIILCREYSELNFGLICKWLVEKNGRMTIQNLTLLFNDTFSTRVLVSKIAEKMKAYGLWETFVTDSFEEYIDNLVVNTDLELDDNDLFQEEFF